MRQPIKLIIKKGKQRKDGTSLIFLQYCYSQTKRILIGTNIGIPESYWNKKRCEIVNNLPKEYGNAESLEAELRDKLRHAEKLIDYALKHANTCPVKFLKRNFLNRDDRYLQAVGYDFQKLDVFYQIDKYIRDKTGLVQGTTITTIRTMKKHLLSSSHDLIGPT